MLKKAYNCAVGHDFEAARRVSRCRFEAHVSDALLAVAILTIKRHCVVTNLLSEHRYRPKCLQGYQPAFNQVEGFATVSLESARDRRARRLSPEPALANNADTGLTG